MLLEKLALFLDGMHEFRYIRDGHRIEVWLSGREELPVVVSSITSCRYLITWLDLVYEVKDTEKAYRYALRVFLNMGEDSIGE
jgi:hypothetical protein